MMRGGLIYALAQLSGRERALLLLLSVLVVPLAVGFLLVQPMLQAREEARLAAVEARALLEWVSDQVALLPADTAQADTATEAAPEPIGISGIEDSLVSLGLRANVSQLANRAEGGVDLTLEEAPFELIASWLQQIAPHWGYRLAAFRIESVSPGLVNASFELVPAL